jgi:hypothetical protein
LAEDWGMLARKLRKTALTSGRRAAKVVYVRDRLVNVVLTKE